MSLSLETASPVPQIGDVTALSQMSSDEIVTNNDVSHTHDIILAGRQESDIDEDLLDTVIPLNLFDILRKGAINLVLPFINGVMLGFGEIFAHEIGFKYGFVGARVQPPRRQAQKPKFI